MNILLDFIPFQHLGGVSGAASFTMTVTEAVARRRPAGVRLFAVYDSALPVTGRYDCRALALSLGITLADIAGRPLRAVAGECRADVLFIAIAQLYRRYDLSGVDCKTVMFIHDIFDMERADNFVDATVRAGGLESAWSRLKRLANIYSGRSRRLAGRTYARLMPLYTAPLTVPYTVSDYSRRALEYYFPAISRTVRVCYSPLKRTARAASIDNAQLRQLVATGKRYLLMVSANRLYKNPHTLARVFARLEQEYTDLHLLTLKLGCVLSGSHTDVSYLSDSDLAHAYEHALALVFPSYFEGFGYPPVEAMEYGTPTVASNVTSIPEVLGDAAVYFSPFYPADLYRALKEVIDHPHLRADAMRRRLAELRRRQEHDLGRLVDDLLTPAPRL